MKLVTPGAASQDKGGAEEQQTDKPAELLAYGYLRGSRLARFIEFQRRGQEPISARYSDLELIRGPSSRRRDLRGEAFVLEFRGNRKAIVSGCILRVIVEGIKRESVTRLTELDEDVVRFLPENVSAIYAIDMIGWEEEEAQSVDRRSRAG
jgi:hypothetical protein